MKNRKKIILGLCALMVCMMVMLGTIFISMGPTMGKKIEAYPNPQKALLVIDIQKDYTGETARPPFPYKDAGRLITTVNRLTREAKRKNIPVVYIRQEFEGLWGRLVSKLFAGATAIKGNPGTEIDARISIISGHIFGKPKGDAFSNPNFEAFLVGQQVNEIFICGLDAEFCVYMTGKGALNRGYQVNIITDAILLKDEKKWDALLEKYHRDGIRLLSHHEF